MLLKAVSCIAVEAIVFSPCPLLCPEPHKTHLHSSRGGRVHYTRAAVNRLLCITICNDVGLINMTVTVEKSFSYILRPVLCCDIRLSRLCFVSKQLNMSSNFFTFY